jgi:hypothetical protein
VDNESFNKIAIAIRIANGGKMNILLKDRVQNG